MKSASMFPRYLSLIVCHFDFSCVADSDVHGAEQSLERIVDVEVDTASKLSMFLRTSSTSFMMCAFNAGGRESSDLMMLDELVQEGSEVLRPVVVQLVSHGERAICNRLQAQNRRRRQCLIMFRMRAEVPERTITIRIRE